MSKQFVLCGVLVSFVLTLCLSIQASGADTLRTTLEDAEAVFLKENLVLLAARFDIEAAEAQRLQAQLWPNPNFSLEQNLYNPNNRNMPLDVSGSSQFIVEVNQIIYLAKQRQKRTRLADLDVQLAEYQFVELMRTLRHELRKAHLDVFFALQRHRVYKESIATLNKLVQVYELQLAKGNVPLTEVARLKALLLDYENESADLLIQIQDLQLTLRLLLRLPTTTFYRPLLPVEQPDISAMRSWTADSLYELALTHRVDYRIAETQARQADAAVTYEKAMATPNLNAGFVFDRYGSFGPNYAGARLSIDVPFFNRNQGNIRTAEAFRGKLKTKLDYAREEMAQQIGTTLEKMRIDLELAKHYSPENTEQFERLLAGIIKEYEKRNISLIEFTEYYQTFRDYTYKKINHHEQLFDYMEDINYYAGLILYDF